MRKIGFSTACFYPNVSMNKILNYAIDNDFDFIEIAVDLKNFKLNSLDKVLLCPGGSGAIGMALKLARVATGRHKTISMWDSFHGASLDAISIGGEAIFRQDMGPMMPGTEHAPPPDEYRCIFGCAGRTGCDGCDLTCAKYVEYMLEKEGDVAAVVAEPIRSTPYIPPPEYWQIIRKACDKHGTLLIFDEIPHCIGRTGKMFTFENFNIIPDMVAIGKGLGGGIFPLAALIARKDLDLAATRALGHYTHEKSPVGCAAALATINYIEKNIFAGGEIIKMAAENISNKSNTYGSEQGDVNTSLNRDKYWKQNLSPVA